MLKESIRLPLIFLVVSTIWRLLANNEVKWSDNIGVCLIMFLILLFYNWSKIPYKWKKDKNE